MPYTLRLGDPNVGAVELDVLHAMLDGADLVCDATAELGSQHLLFDLTRERAIPYVYLWTTPGAGEAYSPVFGRSLGPDVRLAIG